MPEPTLEPIRQCLKEIQEKILKCKKPLPTNQLRFHFLKKYKKTNVGHRIAEIVTKAVKKPLVYFKILTLFIEFS